MLPELMNLLPPERERELARAYRYRLITVAAVALGILTIIHGILLIPTHRYLAQQITAREGELASFTHSIAASDQATLTQQVALLSSESQTLAALASTTPELPFVSEMLSVPRTGILLSQISLMPTTAGETMTLTGVASTRDALRAYDQALSSASFVQSVNLPISAYAASTNIAFTMALMLAPATP